MPDNGYKGIGVMFPVVFRQGMPGYCYTRLTIRDGDEPKIWCEMILESPTKELKGRDEDRMKAKSWSVKKNWTVKSFV